MSGSGEINPLSLSGSTTKKKIVCSTFLLIVFNFQGKLLVKSDLPPELRDRVSQVLDWDIPKVQAKINKVIILIYFRAILSCLEYLKNM